MEFKIFQKGAVSLYLALMTMIILLAIGLGITTIIISQMRMIRGMGDSVVAIYAADSGIEKILYEDKKCYQAGCISLPCKKGCFGLANRAEFSDNLGEANYIVTYVICPDFDGDGIVTGPPDGCTDCADCPDNDFCQLVLRFGEQLGDPNWDSKFDIDINGNGRIDIDDFIIISGSVGTECRGYGYYTSKGEFKQTTRAIEVTRKGP